MQKSNINNSIMKNTHTHTRTTPNKKQRKPNKTAVKE